jgi:hypothetical protein
MGKPDPVPTQVKRASLGGSQDDNIPMVTERRRKLRPWLPVDDDGESDGAQADEEPLAGSRVRTTSLANVDTGTRRRSVVVSTLKRSFDRRRRGPSTLHARVMASHLTYYYRMLLCALPPLFSSLYRIMTLRYRMKPRPDTALSFYFFYFSSFLPCLIV